MKVSTTLLAALCIGLPAAAAAQPYPHKLVRVILSSPGGGTDIVARMVAEGMSKSIGVPFVVESRQPSVAAAGFVAKAPADGSTLMVSTASYIYNALLRQTPYDPLRDFTSLSILGTTPIIIVVHPSLPVRSLQDLVALAKKRPGDLSYGSGGVGSPIHLAAELFKQTAGVNMLHIPFKGTAHAATDLLAGRIEMLCSSILSVQSQIQTGRLKVLAVMNEKRSPELPEVPTTAEAGYPGLHASIWYSLTAPAHVPPALAERLSREAAAAVRNPAVTDKFKAAGVDPTGSTAEQHAAFAAAEYTKWKKVISAARIDTGI
jgi:tripartite-type tricarboxylate transporter receptor subunit TctC